jgi:hypothetical protein
VSCCALLLRRPAVLLIALGGTACSSRWLVVLGLAAAAAVLVPLAWPAGLLRLLPGAGAGAGCSTAPHFTCRQWHHGCC